MQTTHDSDTLGGRPFVHQPVSRRTETLMVELQRVRAREEVLLAEKQQLLLRQALLAQEFEHRLINGMQIITSLLSLQSRSQINPEAADQLMIASRRVGALARVHRRLHLLDRLDRVELTEYVRGLCRDLDGLLARDGGEFSVVVDGASVDISTALAIPLGFIVSELVTNAAKYADGQVMIRIDATSPTDRRLSVVDAGPGLPVGFQPSQSNGLGMAIIQSFVLQIHGAMQILPGAGGRGTEFRITF